MATTTKINYCQKCDSDNVGLFHVHNRFSPDWFFVKCRECEMAGEYERTPEEAVKIWNGDDGDDE